MPVPSDESLTAYIDAVDRYTNSVDELCRFADGIHHAEFLASRERVKKSLADVEEARSAMTKSRNT